MAEPQNAMGAATTPTTKPTDGGKLTEDLIKGINGEVDTTVEDLSKMFDRRDAEGRGEIRKMIDALLAPVLDGKRIKAGLFKRIDMTIAEIDARLAKQVNAIIHQPEFKALEGAWRGLEYLVKCKPPGQHVQVRVLNISKKKLGDTLEKFSSESGQVGWDQSPIFKQAYRDRFDMPGGEPFGCMVGDYQFDKSATDINLLKRLSQVCGAAHMPFLSAASPNLLGLKSWRDLPDVAEIGAKMSTPDYAAWNSLRQSEDSRYLGLTLPRFLARLPYGPGKNPVESFEFTEDLRPTSEGESKHDNYVWANAAYAMAANIADAFHTTAFCVAIRGVEGGGKVEGLPIDTFPTDDGGVDAQCPTEYAISQRREAELGRLGFLPLSHWQNTDYAAFVGAQTVQKPQKYSTPEATANAELSARLPYVFMVSRFAHYLKKMVYDWVGTTKDKDALTTELNDWIGLYTSDPKSDEQTKAEKPLAEARIEVEEIEGKPGYFHAKAYLRPHIQLEGLDVDLGLVQKMPGGG